MTSILEPGTFWLSLLHVVAPCCGSVSPEQVIVAYVQKGDYGLRVRHCYRPSRFRLLLVKKRLVVISMLFGLL